MLAHAAGLAVAAAPPGPTSTRSVMGIPTIDISAEKDRQVIVERIPGQYLGHPTTVLMGDGRTIFVTYPLGHGGPAAVLKKSMDGGLTWSERLPVPDNWKTATKRRLEVAGPGLRFAERAILIRRV